MNEIRSEVIRLIAETLEISPRDIGPETSIRSLPNVESIRLLNVILKVEKRFGVEIPDTATFRMETVGEFVDLVTTQLAEQGRPIAVAN